MAILFADNNANHRLSTEIGLNGYRFVSPLRHQLPRQSFHVVANQIVTIALSYARIV